MAAPALKNAREMGDFDIICQSKGIYTQLILCHFSLTIFVDFWDFLGKSPSSQLANGATAELQYGKLNLHVPDSVLMKLWKKYREPQSLLCTGYV